MRLRKFKEQMKNEKVFVLTEGDTIHGVVKDPNDIDSVTRLLELSFGEPILVNKYRGGYVVSSPTDNFDEYIIDCEETSFA